MTHRLPVLRIRSRACIIIGSVSSILVPMGALSRIRKTGPLESGNISLPTRGVTKIRMSAVTAKYPMMTGL